ncbi:MAG: fatty acid desaturase family protein, partial [Chitinophagaceae bacterium]
MYKVTFNNKNKVFFNTLKASVDKYFEDNNLKKTGNWRLYLKTAILIPAVFVIYFMLLFLPMHWAIDVFLCVVLGISMASIGFNVMHDACHGSFSTRPWVNEVFGLTHNFLGGNAFLWKLKHNIVHHTYTNVDGIDDDINNMPFMRECSTQPWKPMHKFQSYYMFVLYGFTSLFMFFMDYIKYFTRKVYTTPITKMDPKDHILFWIGKLFFIAIYIIIPIIAVGWQNWIVGFVAVQFSLGITIALVFQL